MRGQHNDRLRGDVHIEASRRGVWCNDCHALFSSLPLNARLGGDIFISAGQAAQEINNLKDQSSLQYLEALSTLLKLQMRNKCIGEAMGILHVQNISLVL